ncbi:ubiquilin-1 [Drosophila madeirensis]|uniref:Ubiquilin-1 n=1 Tax=Drosophila madeirensis TaxID=30013 RepID=A0AAU9F5J1_DROMD
MSIDCLAKMTKSNRLKMLVKRNVRMKVIQLAQCPAKQEYDRIRRDLLVRRMELVPGGPQLLARLDGKMRRSYENSVAMTYQHFPAMGNGNGRTHQRGLENRLPLPNPWKPTCNALHLASVKDTSFLSRMYTYLQKRYREQLQKLIEMASRIIFTICSLRSSLWAAWRMPSSY